MKEDNYKLPEKNIKLAKYAGFCYGVKRAVETVKKLKAENPNKNVFVLGELIHNTYLEEIICINALCRTMCHIPASAEWRLR